MSDTNLALCAKHKNITLSKILECDHCKKVAILDELAESLDCFHEIDSFNLSDLLENVEKAIADHRKEP